MDQLEDIEFQPETIPTKAWFVFTIIYLFIDYVRPQDTIKVLGYIRPAMVFTIILSVFLLRNFRLINWKIPQTRLIWCFIILLAVYIPFARNNHHAYIATNAIFLLMPFILSCICCINSLDRLKKVLFFCILFMVYQAQFAIRHHGCGTGSQFLDENDFSLYMNTWLPFCFIFFLSEKIPWKKILYGLFTALGIAANVIGRSRGGFMGLIVMFFIFWIFNPKKFISLLVIGIIALSLYLYAGDQYWNRMATASDAQHGTAKERIESWKAGWNMFLHNPLGVGGNNYQVRFPEYQSDYFKRGMWGRVAHSLWFTLLPETGVIGTIIFLLLLFINIRDVFRLRKKSQFYDQENGKFFRNLSVALLASLAGFFTSASFISVLYYAHYWYISGFIASTTLIINKSISSIPETDATNVA